MQTFITDLRIPHSGSDQDRKAERVNHPASEILSRRDHELRKIPYHCVCVGEVCVKSAVLDQMSSRWCSLEVWSVGCRV
ncbi:hypothetical protein AVEN_175841-1, partial [Araneus ventricosus]